MVNGHLIEVEGIDRSGKDSLIAAIHKKTNYRYNLRSRGMISQLVYNDKFKRGIDYKFDYTPVIIYLDIDNETYLRRCLLTGEQPVNTTLDERLFNLYITRYINHGGIVLKYDASNTTAESLADVVIRDLEQIIDK